MSETPTRLRWWAVATLGVIFVTLSSVVFLVTMVLAYKSMRPDSLGRTFMAWANGVGIVGLGLLTLGLFLAVAGMLAFRQFDLKSIFGCIGVFAVALTVWRVLDPRPDNAIAVLLAGAIGYGWYWVLTRMPKR